MANPPYSFSSENPVTTLTLGPKAPYIQHRAVGLSFILWIQIGSQRRHMNQKSEAKPRYTKAKPFTTIDSNQPDQSTRILIYRDWWQLEHNRSISSRARKWANRVGRLRNTRPVGSWLCLHVTEKYFWVALESAERLMFMHVSRKIIERKKTTSDDALPRVAGHLWFPLLLLVAYFFRLSICSA